MAAVTNMARFLYNNYVSKHFDKYSIELRKYKDFYISLTFLFFVIKTKREYEYISRNIEIMLSHNKFVDYSKGLYFNSKVRYTFTLQYSSF